jgi:hypothetical protein
MLPGDLIMNVGHVKGPGGVDPTPQRSPGAKSAGTSAGSGRVADQASISVASREALAVAEELTHRVQQEPVDRQGRVDAARERLERGELDSVEARRGAAERLLGLDDGLGGF